MTDLDPKLVLLRRRSRCAALVSAIGALLVFGSLAAGSILLGGEVAERRALSHELARTVAERHREVDAATDELRRLEAQLATARQAVALIDAQKREAQQRSAALVDDVVAAADANACKRLARQLDDAAAPMGGANGRARALWRKGQAALLEGKPHAAAEGFQAAIAVDPRYAPAHDSLGKLAVDGAFPDGAAIDEQRVEAGVAHFRKALEVAPTYNAARLHLAELELRRGNPAEAERLAGDILALRPDHPEAIKLLTEIKASEDGAPR